MTVGGHFLTIHEDAEHLYMSEDACFVVTASSNNQIFTHMDANLSFLMNVFIINLIR